MKYLLPFLLFILLLPACHTPEKSFLSAYLNAGNLPLQSFTISPDKDTTLTSSGGIRITIAKGTFATGQPVEIEWKEALTFQDILKAGLTTQSGKNILRSGGMFYFNTKEKQAIQKPIGIGVPTQTIASGMQLYKGDSTDGKLDWQDPKPIENRKAFGDNALGKALFDGNCAQCHKVDQALTGPGLLGVSERRSKPWLYSVIRNAAAMAAFDPVICCEKAKYGVMMQSFPGLSVAEMDSIYAHIDYETEQLKKSNSIQGFGCDECMVENPRYDSLLVIWSRGWSHTLVEENNSVQDTVMAMENMDWPQQQSFYQVSIQANGWYNIDALYKEWSKAEPGNLIVYPKGEVKEEILYYLAIPALKIFTSGTVQSNGETVVFDDTNGNIPLPLQRSAFIVAAGREADKYYFAKKEFIISRSQIIKIPVRKMSKQEFDEQMKELAYSGLKIETYNSTSYTDTTNVSVDSTTPEIKVNDSSYEKPQTEIEVQLKRLGEKKRKNCGCNGYARDSTIGK